MPIPTKILVRDFAVAVESAVSKNEKDASDLRLRVCGLLRMARVPGICPSNALKKLKEMEDSLMVSPVHFARFMTIKRLETRIKEHKYACSKGQKERSVAEHA